MKEKYNFKIDSVNNTVLIEVSPAVFPKSVILHAAYHFIEDEKVIIEGGEEKITVTLIPEEKLKEDNLEELAYEFNIQLISSFVEGEESRKHAGIRDTMMRAALSSPPHAPTQMPKLSPRPQNNQEKK